jgi:hypothetical protein
MRSRPKPKTKRFRLFHSSKQWLQPLVAILVFGMIGSTLLYLSFAQHNDSSENNLPAITANPPVINQSCLGGLDVAVLVDVSTSISVKNGDFGTMQQALKDFVSALLPSTKTQISVTSFSTDSRELQSLTSNVTTLNSTINELQSGGGTNWAAGLQTAYETFNGEPISTPKILLVATDGDPTIPEDNPLGSAITVANQIKRSGIHILAVGVGDGLKVGNLQDIAGNNVNTGGINMDVITTNYTTLGSALQNIARNTCSNGTGNGGNGNGNGGTGNGNGTGGTGTGSNGIGTGTVGAGNGTTGSGTGSGVGPTPAPSPTPQPTADQGVVPSPAPTNVPDQEPTPAPAAVPTPEPSPTPAPTPIAQGIKAKPPQPQPSPFYDGKQYPAGSAPDDFVATKRHHGLATWVYITIAAAILAAAGGGFWFWRTKKASRVMPRKPKQ